MGLPLRNAWLLLAAASLAAAPACSEVSPSEADPPGASARALPDAEVRRALDALLGSDLDAARAAVARIVEAGDPRFVSVLIELIRASEIGLLHADGRQAYGRALDALTGEEIGNDWFRWMTWYAASDLEAPPGFTGWKGRLLARIDPRFGELLTDDAPSRIRSEEIVWGGVAYEGIPALDRAPTIPAAEAGYLEPGEPVFGLVLAGEARAYPHRILDWHEMANDVVGGIPVSLAYCTLCGTGIAFDGRARDGSTYDFGSSGFLMRSNKLMVDRQTRTLWNQFTGRPVLGPLAARELRLDMHPMVVTTWAEWRAQHPETRVLSLETGYQRPYVPGAAYAGYFASPETLFPVRRVSALLPPKERVYGIEEDGVPKAWPLGRLVDERVVNDAVGDRKVVLVATRDRIHVDGESVRSGPATYDAGGEVRAFARGEERFAPGPDADTLLDARGRPWRVTEEALLGPEGATAPRLNGVLGYWFGWSGYHPRTLLYGAEVAAKEVSE